ncbi:alkaline phosphatase, partial [Thermaurantiacus sp.]
MLTRLLCALVLMLGLAPALAQERPKNIIVMIADGAGYNMLAATRLWRGGPLAVDAPGFTQMAQSVYPLRTGNTAVEGPEGLAQDTLAVYAPARAWDSRPLAGPSRVLRFESFPAAFAGYEWARATYPDSANTATAMATGVKSYNNAINVDGNGRPLLSLAEVAKASGKATGVVTTVQLGDATPAAFGGAHSTNRGNRQAIVMEMFSSGTLDLIAGTGHPEHDDDGRRRAPAYRWFTEAMWADLKAGTNISGVQGKGRPWTLLTRREDVQAIAAGRAAPPERLAIVIEADEGHQAYRACEGCDRATMAPYATPRLASSPTLTELTMAAFARLGGAPQGFYLMIEGGAVDRAMHANFLGRAIEEYDEFDAAVRAVVDWIER